ncbi:TlpA family protein disulfide reductase (plasmid) [Coraliomargarita sp. W4R53]
MSKPHSLIIASLLPCGIAAIHRSAFARYYLTFQIDPRHPKPLLAFYVMTPTAAFIALAALLISSVVIGLVMKSREGRARQVRPSASEQPATVGAAHWGEQATLLQFSTEFCTRCPGVHRTLSAIAVSTPGVIHLDVDLTHRTDLAKHFNILQTPTTLILDGEGVVRTRLGGTIARANVEHELQQLLGAQHVFS